MRLKPGTELVLSMDILFLETNGSLTVNVEDRDRNQVFPVTFTCSPTLIAVQDAQTTYGLGPCRTWTRLKRDLFVDLLKGNVLAGRGKKLIRTRLRLLSLTLKGAGQVDNVRLAGSDHGGMFYSAVDWLVRHQDANGGWPIDVRRKIASGLADLVSGSAINTPHPNSPCDRWIKLTQWRLNCEGTRLVFGDGTGPGYVGVDARLPQLR